MVGLIINHRMKMHNVDEQVNSGDEEVFTLRSSISYSGLRFWALPGL